MRNRMPSLINVSVRPSNSIRRGIGSNRLLNVTALTCTGLFITVFVITLLLGIYLELKKTDM